MTNNTYYCESAVCGKPLMQTPGKRRKRFCNDTCRSNHHQKKKRIAKNLGMLVPSGVAITSVPVPPPVYDGPKLGKITHDEAPKYVTPKNKEMPAGLSKTEQLRWMRENKL